VTGLAGDVAEAMGAVGASSAAACATRAAGDAVGARCSSIA
jgi:hypothetical protein